MLEKELSHKTKFPEQLDLHSDPHLQSRALERNQNNKMQLPAAEMSSLCNFGSALETGFGNLGGAQSRFAAPSHQKGPVEVVRASGQVSPGQSQLGGDP